MKKIISPILIVQLTLSIAFAQPLKYHEVIVNHINRQHIVQFTQYGFIINNVTRNSVCIHIPTDKIFILDELGLHYQIISHNRKKRNSNGYPTINQLSKTLQTFEGNYPTICKLFDIGKSHEGRPLYFIKISDHVEHEEDEPEVKYIASMHGDEPVGAMLSINLIDEMLQNYQKDPFITDLIDHLEIWIMPLMNPDGYVHQQRMNIEGIDLNRNFPDRVNDNSNTTTNRAIEVQHVMNWEAAHSSVLSANYHSGTVVVNYPYDSDFNPYANYSATPDEDLFREMALSYANLNPEMRNSTRFDYGITNGVEWYMVYGGMQDWSYVWMGCMELTIELSYVKWPDYSEISKLWDDNRDAMLNYFTWAQKGIRGIVTNAVTGEPVYASIQVQGNNFRVYTDPDIGDYHRILLPGTYHLIISAEGYQTKNVTDIQVFTNDATRLDLTLTPISISDVIIMLKTLSTTDTNLSMLSYDINLDHQLDLADILLALNYLGHSTNK